MTNLKIDAGRLMSRIDALAEVGRTAEGGVHRLALGDDDRIARDRVVDWMRGAGLEVEIDGIGNIIGIRPGTEALPPVMTGSHIDSVANGGKLDGSYGVLAGIEAVETLNDAGIDTPRPIAVCVFTNEEGARFQPDMMGSLVYAGGLSVDEALAREDDDGVLLGDALARIGYRGDAEIGSVRPHAFVELHVEQGPILEAESITIGAVESLQGISWTRIDIEGQANHAGTTPMAGRRDAGYCAARIGCEVRAITQRIGGNQVGTVGVVTLEPGIINVVASKARVSVDLRNTDNERLELAERMLDELLDELIASEGVCIESERLARFDPVQFDDRIAAIIESKATHLGLSCRRMASGAGHDAQMMARLCPAAMIFVPSIGGISHNPHERTNVDDLRAGADVLLHTLVDLAHQ